MGARSFTQAEIERAKRLRSMGYTLGKIAKEMGRSRAGVERIIANPFSDGLACSDCSTPISNNSASGRCKSCNVIRNNKKPDLIAKRMEGIQRSLEDPIKYARRCQLAANNIRKAMADPEKRAAAIERGKVKAEKHFNTPEGRAWSNRPEVRARAAKSLSETRMGWCPPEYRETYRQLMRQRLCDATEGRALIAEQIRKDRERARSELSPFERQMRALENGARLVANDIRPSLANPGVYRVEDAA